MTAGEYCMRDTVIVSKDEPIQAAIDLMRQQHVGDVVVVEKKSEQVLPVGILTDRDIVLEILGQGVDLAAVAIDDVMSRELVCADEDTSLPMVIKLMRDHGVRRLPVVDAGGGLGGIFLMDDLLGLVAEQLNDIVTLLSREQKQEKQTRAT